MRRISYQNSTLLHWGGREKFTSTSFCNWVTFDEDDAATSPFFTNWTDVALSKCNMLIFTLSSKKKKTLVKLHDKVGGSNFYLKKLIKIELSWLARKPLPDSSFALNLCFTDRDPDLYKVWSAFDCFLDTLYDTHQLASFSVMTFGFWKPKILVLCLLEQLYKVPIVLTCT